MVTLISLRTAQERVFIYNKIIFKKNWKNIKQVICFCGGRHLPNNLMIIGDLSLNQSNLIELPENLYVTGNLDLRFTDVSYLPKSLTVLGHVLAVFTKIKTDKHYGVIGKIYCFK